MEPRASILSIWDWTGSSLTKTMRCKASCEDEGRTWFRSNHRRENGCSWARKALVYNLWWKNKKDLPCGGGLYLKVLRCRPPDSAWMSLRKREREPHNTQHAYGWSRQRGLASCPCCEEQSRDSFEMREMSYGKQTWTKTVYLYITRRSSKVPVSLEKELGRSVANH